MNRPTLDVVIPCYNAAATVQRAADSVLTQRACRRLILVDDGSHDDTAARLQTISQTHPDRVTICRLPDNGGVARARNWGALASDADLLAFLDADDAYETGALDVVPDVFHFMPDLSLLRLKLTPIGLAERYAAHPNWPQAWDILQMTVGGNMVLRRTLLLACGGFPQDELFRRLGGEDGALGIALAETTAVGTLFEAQHRGVLHYCRDGMHAERLLDAYLFDRPDPRITPEATAYARTVTERIKRQLAAVRPIVHQTAAGRRPLIIEYAD